MADSDSSQSTHTMKAASVNFLWWPVMITAIVYGSIHLHDCTIQPFIPIYLIVFGVTSIISLCMTSCSKKENSFTLTIMNLLHTFNVCWLISGSVWVYSIYPPNYTPGEDPYCHKTTYLLAFGIITVVWVFCACALICGCCACVLMGCGVAFAVVSDLILSRDSAYGATGGSANSAVENV